MKTIFDPSFRYSPSFNTDIKKTFARIRRGHRQALQGAVQAPAPVLVNVASITKRTAGLR
jgi:hypothetical protein